MKNWQAVLEHFALYPEPQSWDIPRDRIRLPPQEKWDSVKYLLDKGFIDVAGQQRGEQVEPLYQITPTGRFVWQAGFCQIGRRHRRAAKPQVVDTETLATRTVAMGLPRSVWELAEKPWAWVKKPEHDRFTDAELAKLIKSGYHPIGKGRK